MRTVMSHFDVIREEADDESSQNGGRRVQVNGSVAQVRFALARLSANAIYGGANTGAIESGRVGATVAIHHCWTYTHHQYFVHGLVEGHADQCRRARRCIRPIAYSSTYTITNNDKSLYRVCMQCENKISQA